MSSEGAHGIRYCPRCGGNAFAVRVPPRDDRPRPVCRACGYTHYVGPVLAAGTVLRDGARICLVRRALRPGRGLWTFPGGFVDYEEDPAGAALRETEEETGCRAEIESLLGAYRSEGPRGKRVVIVVYVARLVEAGACACEEVAEVRWFEPDALPWDELAFASTAEALRDLLGRSATGG